MSILRRAATALGGATLFLAAGFAQPSLKTMSTSEIRPGMRGYGLTVLRGTEPERFPVEVIDVLDNFRPDQDLVLIRTPHPVLEHAGSVAGMSGSPIYLDGRLIGAYAYGWSFGKDPIAGVTPIANMLKELDRPLLRPGSPIMQPLPLPVARAKQRGRADPHEKALSTRGAKLGGYRGGERRDAFWALSRYVERHPRPASQLVPVATPLLVGGLPARAAELLRERFAPLGLEVLEAAGGAAGRKREKGAAPAAYVNGGALAVTLLRGDVQATAVGTVTYVDGERAVAFGHPMLDAGELALPTSTARILHVLASERSSFKIAEALEPLGALVHDRQSAVVVDTHENARTIPVDIELSGLPDLPRAHWHVETANHRLLTPSLVMTALASALGASANDAAEMMFRAESVVTLKKHGAQRVVDEGFAPSGVGQPLALSRLRLFDLLEVAYDNPFEHAEIEHIAVKLDLRLGHEVSEIVGAQLARDELDPGEPARLVVTLRPFEGKPQQHVVEVPLPETLAGEHLELHIVGGSQVEVEQPLPESLADVLATVRAGLPSTTLVVVVERKSRGVSLAGHVVKDLPGSALDALATVRDTARNVSFAMERRIALPLNQIVVGKAKLGLDVRKEKR